jgi:THUMP domain-containing protein
LSRLRKDLSHERAHLVTEQVELRRRARDKFSLAEQMFFTRKGLEQATDELIAAYKAQRFQAGKPIVDLCCGIGGDLISLARRATAQGVDRDPVAALLAATNVSAHGLADTQCSVVTNDVFQVPIGGAAWHCDPDRRAEGRRATRGELFEPPLESLVRLLDESGQAAIKLAPATDVPAAWCEAAELEWLGSRGECRQQVAWFGRLARNCGQRSATIVAPRGVRTIVGDVSHSLPPPAELGRFVFEPHPAVLAAQLTGVLCREYSLAPIAPGIAYLTGDRHVDDLALDVFEVHDLLPFDRKRLKAYCRDHRRGRLEIKKRGVNLDPQRLRTEIIGCGDGAATILIAPIAGQVRAIVATRLVHET